jgi:hypothetical protein
MTSTMDSPDEDAWVCKVKRLSPSEREHRTAAVDILLDKPDELNDILESELWTLRDLLQSQP